MGGEIGADARFAVCCVVRDRFESANDCSVGAMVGAGRFLVDAGVLDPIFLVPDAECCRGALFHEELFIVGVVECRGVVPEFNVGDCELVRDPVFRGFEVRVFPDSQEIVECDDCHVADGLGAWGV